MKFTLMQYHTVPGTDLVIPLMTLGEEVTTVTRNSSTQILVDPVAEAVKRGKAPTLGDVKKSVKV
jgi:meiosis-specific protein